MVPPNGPIDWTVGDTVGVPGGIRGNRARCVTVACAALEGADAPYKDGTSDATALFQAAIDSAEAETYVFIPAGIWRIDGSINLGANRDGITVRGAGMAATTIDCRNNVCINVGSSSDYRWNYPDTGNVITDGLTQGSTELTIADTSAFSVGQIVQLKISNDVNLPVISVGGAFEYLRRQMTLVTAKTATSLSVHPPIYGNWNHLAARVNLAQLQTDFVGIEDLTVDGSNGNITFAIMFEQAFGSWIKGVKVRHASNYSVFFTDTLQCELRESFLDELDHEGSNGAGLLVNTASGSLVEDNIIIEAFPNIEVNHGSSGNVFAYNFINNVDGLVGIDTNHGPHNSFNLYEGNVVHNLMSDGYFGSASDDFVIRNWLHGGGGVVGNSLTYCLSLKRFTRNYTIAGNLIGSAQHTDGCASYGQPNIGNGSWVGEAQPSTGDYWADWNPTDGVTIRGSLTERTDDMHGTITLVSGSLTVGQTPLLASASGEPLTSVIVTAVAGNSISIDSSAFATVLPPVGTVFAIGAGAGGYQELDLDVEATTIKQSNYYFYLGEIPSGEVAAEELSSSYYLTAKPAWFGDLTWPPFDPNDPTTVANQIPAQVRFLAQ